MTQNAIQHLYPYDLQLPITSSRCFTQRSSNWISQNSHSIAYEKLRLAEEKGGCTLHPFTAVPVEFGFPVGLEGFGTPFSHIPSVSQLAADIKGKIGVIVNANIPLFLGSWLKNQHCFVVDIVRVFKELDEAILFGKANNQEYTYSLHEGKDFPIKNSTPINEELLIHVSES